MSIYPEGYKTTDEKEKSAIEEFDSTQHLPWSQYLYHNVRVFMSVYIIGVHILGVLAIPCLFVCKQQTLYAAFIFDFIGKLGITAGSHRLYSHKSFKASSVYRWFIMILASIANEAPIYNWVLDHRVHHKYSETRADPHNALRGFFFAHVGWLLVKKDPRIKFAGSHVPMDDIRAMPEVMFQKRMDPYFSMFCCFIAPTLIGLSWNETLYNSFMILGIFKYLCTLHATWMINSIAHLYGSHPYDLKSHPAESPFAAFFSIGEGWHSYHHAFPSDYATSEFGWLVQWNPTRLFIDLCAFIGIVSERKRMDEICERRVKNNESFTIRNIFPFFKYRL